MSERRSSLLRSTPFRLALTFAFLFLLAFILSGAVVYQLMSASLARQLDQSIRETYSLIAATHAESDEEDLVSTVRDHAQFSQDKDEIFSLTDKAGNRLAGDFTASGLPDGFSMFAADLPGVPPGTGYRAYSGTVGDNNLTVAFSLSETEDLERIVLMSFGWATLAITVLAIGGGAVLASRVQRRLDGIASTMVDVSHGLLDARIPLIGSGDDIDAVSAQVNAALERLSGLVDGMREVSANIAHDLKTPLNRLQMILEQAADKTASGEDVSTELTDARIESQQINSTFDALLRIAQIEAGARKARFVDLDVGPIVETIGDVYADVAEDDGKSLSTSVLPDTKWYIHGDRDLLMQMLANLVENALRHCPPGTAIGLSVTREGGDVLIHVRDNGPGIPAEEREKVFRRLYRLDASRTTPGSGLGLSLVKAVADLHGAAITLEDCKPGLGVIVSFPAVRVPEA
ncbi:HAMP domain-containing histidine kinase [Mesorhizobium sp. M2A.F.Ca.ET.042.01.1.1]|uniref:sensor histidine kinase n=1 Tax=Mesorhizobium sp. M2A.F.Ca.ET.042.01.1.1 TaxID=2496745 RepID=UPI000FCAEF22|nr:HAMP domain-containing sensor histidine kinase [Mesorhizobium sp. M2A.F.Ca.ET.042.01.1.1]RUX27644.1 HAMP domain-containing histidine kinase [Mesorhizobium sp. M2A.F.Ca.ET.042.01.1.1]